MPTLANATVVMHLYDAPRSGGEPGKQWAKFKGFTCDKVKSQDGERKMQFSVWEGFVRGIHAEWLIKDAKKGSAVCVTGTIRITSFTNKEGVLKPYGEFVSVHTATLLDRNGESNELPDAPLVAEPAPVPKKPVVQADDDKDPVPF
jgi:hypothetical protein